MRRALVTLGFLGLQICLSSAQTRDATRPAVNPPPKLLEFEVATIKPLAPDQPVLTGVNVFPGGRVTIDGVD